MSATYRSARTLATKALRLRGSGTAIAAANLPALWFFTDPVRTPRPISIASELPAGSGVVYRHFGSINAPVQAEALAEIARARNLTLLVAADPTLARDVGADGVHLPERMISDTPRLRRQQPDWLITTAVHSSRATRRAAQFDIDALFASPVFPSNSPSAGRPLSPLGFAIIAKATDIPTYALGGVDNLTIDRLTGRGAAGVACVQALAGE